MKPTDKQPLRRLLTLAVGVLRPPAGGVHIIVAFVLPGICSLGSDSVFI